MRFGYVAAATALLVSITQSPAGFAQFSVQGEDGSTVNIGPGGIDVRSSNGNQAAVHVGTSGITVNKRTQPKKNLAAPAGSINMRRGPGTVDMKTALSMLEQAAYGKTNASAPIIVRIEKLEVDNLGAKGSGPNLSRVQALAKTMGVNISVSAPVRTASETIVDSGASSRLPRASASIASVAEGPILSITDNHHEGTLTCNNSAVAIASNHCNLVLTGHCRLLNVTGNHNTIRADNVDNIQALGNHNTIVWVKTPAPAISNQGNYNKIAKASP